MSYVDPPNTIHAPRASTHPIFDLQPATLLPAFGVFAMIFVLPIVLESRDEEETQKEIIIPMIDLCGAPIQFPFDPNLWMPLQSDDLAAPAYEKREWEKNIRTIECD